MNEKAAFDELLDELAATLESVAAADSQGPQE
jgi:hypothetical protein